MPLPAGPGLLLTNARPVNAYLVGMGSRSARGNRAASDIPAPPKSKAELEAEAAAEELMAKHREVRSKRDVSTL